jgi:hypothetical protein
MHFMEPHLLDLNGPNKQSELLRLPFPRTTDLPEQEQADDAAGKLVAIVDDAINAAKMPFALESEVDSTLAKIDRLSYQYYCLSDDEIILIEDAIEKIIPAVQPHEGNYPEVWQVPTEKDRSEYATILITSTGNWLQNEGSVSACLEACSADLGILRLTLDGGSVGYTEATGNSLADVLSRISEHLHQPLDGNFQLMPDLRIFDGKNLYLIKPMQQRFWLRSAALADADAIAVDLQDAVELDRRSRA